MAAPVVVTAVVILTLVIWSCKQSKKSERNLDCKKLPDRYLSWCKYNNRGTPPEPRSAPPLPAPLELSYKRCKYRGTTSTTSGLE